MRLVVDVPLLHLRLGEIHVASRAEQPAFRLCLLEERTVPESWLTDASEFEPEVFILLQLLSRRWPSGVVIAKIVKVRFSLTRPRASPLPSVWIVREPAGGQDPQKVPDSSQSPRQ
jgi:hypothetical protein